MRRKWLRVLLILFAIGFIVYIIGPSPSTPVYNKQLPAVPDSPAALESYIKAQESIHKLRPDNEARIVWSDSAKKVTDYAIVYLHGFTASQAEGDPVHKNIAKEFGCNLYLSRLAEHGIDSSDAMVNLTADSYWESAKQALAIGEKLGHKVIVMGTSTGGSQALQLAAAYPNEVYALVLYSPNIEINDKNAWLLNNHWGLQIARQVVHSNYLGFDDSDALHKQYWTSHYRIEAAVALQELLETTMNKSTFEKVKQPTLLLYYYKDKIHQDSTVKVPAMLKMFDELSTPEAMKRKQAIPNAGNHVIGSYIRSHDVESVQKATESFMRDVLHISPHQ